MTTPPSPKHSEQDIAFMEAAIAEAEQAGAEGEVPIGAVVVCEDRIIARSHNTREAHQDPAGHAEFTAIREACNVLGRWRISDCTIYVTLEPCPMCAGLMHQARVKRCVYGAADPKAGALGTLYDLHADTRLNHVFDVTPGVLDAKCAGLLSDFFKAKREEKRTSKDLDGPDASDGLI